MISIIDWSRMQQNKFPNWLINRKAWHAGGEAPFYLLRRPRDTTEGHSPRSVILCAPDDFSLFARDPVQLVYQLVNLLVYCGDFALDAVDFRGCELAVAPASSATLQDSTTTARSGLCSGCVSLNFRAPPPNAIGTSRWPPIPC